MDCVLFFMMLLFLCIVVFSLSMFAIFPSGFTNHEALLRHITQRFGGKFHAGSWFQKGSVTFIYGTVPAHFCIERADGYPWLRLTVQGSMSGVMLEFTTAAVPQKILNMSLLPEVRDLPNLPQPAIEDGRDYMIYANRETNAELFLSEGVRTQLNILRTSAGGAPLHLTLRKGQLMIAKKWLPGLMQNEMLAEFLYHALRVYDLLQLARAEGIKFVEESSHVGPVEQLKCAVCGEELSGQVVQCKRCQAPHHLDCWNYNGACGTYACKETRYVSQGNPQSVAWYQRLFNKNQDG